MILRTRKLVVFVAAVLCAAVVFAVEVERSSLQGAAAPVEVEDISNRSFDAVYAQLKRAEDSIWVVMGESKGQGGKVERKSKEENSKIWDLTVGGNSETLDICDL